MGAVSCRQYRGRSSGQGGGGGGRRDGPMQSPAPAVRRIEISRDVKLRTSENAWKPGAAKPGADAAAAAAADSADIEVQLVARLKGILNKITPSNIEKHIENIRQLEFDTHECLGRMIDVLFDKAVNEPAYASQYAAVCLAMTKPPVSGPTPGGTGLRTGMVYPGYRIATAVGKCGQCRANRQLPCELSNYLLKFPNCLRIINIK